MFPLSDTIKSSKFPFFTIAIIAINIFAFFQQLGASDLDAFVNNYALIPAQVDFSNINSLLPFITSQFLHGGFFHIISNMWFLWIFGDNVESRFGHFKYLLFYLFAGVVAGFAQYVLSSTSTIPMLGASGAVSGVLGAYFILFRESKIRTLLPLGLIITTADIPAFAYLFYWFILQIFQGIASLPGLSEQTGGVAFWAHIGGFVSGIVVARSMKNREKKFIEGEIV